MKWECTILRYCDQFHSRIMLEISISIMIIQDGLWLQKIVINLQDKGHSNNLIIKKETKYRPSIKDKVKL